jgi:hypothetical protein
VTFDARVRLLRAFDSADTRPGKVLLVSPLAPFDSAEYRLAYGTLKNDVTKRHWLIAGAGVLNIRKNEKGEWINRETLSIGAPLLTIGGDKWQDDSHPMPRVSCRGCQSCGGRKKRSKNAGR